MGSLLEDRHLEVLTTANSRLKRAADTSLWEAMQNEAREKRARPFSAATSAPF